VAATAQADDLLPDDELRARHDEVLRLTADGSHLLWFPVRARDSARNIGRVRVV
jgi:hypothetical protein